LYKIPANTVFIGKSLVFVPECHSTNTLAQQLSQQAGFADGSVIITNNQTAGRGQHGSTWHTDIGQNLTFSVIVKPTFLAIKDQYFLTVITSLAVRDLLKSMVPDKIFIKWPNDILVRHKKICGILIENQIQSSQIARSIIGIGLNVNQMIFNVITATSVRHITHQDYDLESVLHRLLEFLEVRYLQLKQGKTQELRAEYLKALYWRDEKHLFSSAGTTFTGVIDGIDEYGKLVVKTETETRSFEVKELSYLT
jgi:BirA family transcriptional regulator, biotin operon repressor / biotin---[acetyl-CoA-carboxylase] ligase